MELALVETSLFVPQIPMRRRQRQNTPHKVNLIIDALNSFILLQLVLKDSGREENSLFSLLSLAGRPPSSRTHDQLPVVECMTCLWGFYHFPCRFRILKSDESIGMISNTSLYRGLLDLSKLREILGQFLLAFEYSLLASHAPESLHVNRRLALFLKLFLSVGQSFVFFSGQMRQKSRLTIDRNFAQIACYLRSLLVTFRGEVESEKFGFLLKAR